MSRSAKLSLLGTLLAAAWISLMPVYVHAGRTAIESPTPFSFFTNVASHLLRSQLNLDLNRLQLYPTNQYGPAVHRLLQVAANLYDSTTNRPLTAYPYLPSVFRPLFTNDSGVVYITGYAEATDTHLLQAPIRDLADPDARAALESEDMIYGVPAVIGVKKGFPNFNELELQTAVQVSRRLQFVRHSMSWPFSFETNQMYVVGISNVLGVEAWNPYSNNFPRDLQLLLAVDLLASMTNEIGNLLLTNQLRFESVLTMPSNSWEGFVDVNHSATSFKIPLLTNLFLLTNSTYSEALRQFVPLTSTFERNQTLNVPRWWLNLNVRLRFALVDISLTPNRILDYVNLESADAPIDITYELMTGAPCRGPATYNITPYNPGMFWCTNRDSATGPTFGIRAQIDASLGKINDLPFAPFTESQDALYRFIDFFRSNFNGSLPLHGYTVGQTNNFTALAASRTIYLTTS